MTKPTKTEKAAIDPEALAYSDCFKALSLLTYTPEYTDLLLLVPLGGDRGPRPDTTAIRRVLLTLSLRFDAGLIKRPVEAEPPHSCNCEECDR